MMDRIKVEKIKLHELWCQHCKSLQKVNNTIVECWYNPLEHGMETAFCAANEDAIRGICQLFEPKDAELETLKEIIQTLNNENFELMCQLEGKDAECQALKKQEGIK